MKTDEYSIQVRHKVVEKYRSGLGVKKYPKLLTSHLAPLYPLLENGKSMPLQQTCQALASTDFLKGRGEKKKKGHTQCVLTTEEGTLYHLFAPKRALQHMFWLPESTLARVLPPKRAPQHTTTNSTIEKCVHTTAAKSGLPTKTYGPGKKGINPSSNQEAKDDPDGAGQLYCRDWSICPQEHFKMYTPQSWALRKSGQEKKHCLETAHLEFIANLTPLNTLRTSSTWSGPLLSVWRPYARHCLGTPILSNYDHKFLTLLGDPKDALVYYILSGKQTRVVKISLKFKSNILN